MDISAALHALFVDTRFQAALVLVVLDVVFGVVAAFKTHTFRLSYLADFGRNDIAFKLAPWAVLYVAAKFAGGQDLVIPGLDLDVAQNAMYVAIVAAWSASLLSSMKELGFPVLKEAPTSLAGAENAAPPKD